jgi:dual specificity tyrosine-phosphorylation-regulated kinase 2/3/4
MFEIIHCDLKPENIMLKESNKSGIKIIDFGSSAFIDERVYTYIQSRFYRAPEIMLGIPYDCAIDMWSFGCICAELYIGYPLFPGESEQDQLCRIMEMIGMPSTDLLAISERKSRFFKYNETSRDLDPIMFKNSRGKYRRVLGKPLNLVMGDEDPDFNDFVQRCLTMDPRKRLTPNQALRHVWVLKGLPPQVLIHH